MKNWKAGQPVEVKTPDYVRDNIHVDLMALAYAKFATDGTKEPLRRINPSGYAEKQGAFAQRVASEVKARTGWACELKLGQQTDFSEPLDRVNSEPVAKSFPGWSEEAGMG